MIDFSGRPKVQWINSGGPSVPQNLHLLSVAVPDPQSSGAYKFRAGFNLYGYDGSAAATIPTVQPPGLKSIPYLDVVSPTARRFDRPLQPCSISIQDGGRSGTLICPAIADATGARTSLNMRWSLA